MGEAGVRFAKAALPTYGKSNGVAFGACDTQLASNGQRLLGFGIRKTTPEVLQRKL